MVLSWAVTSERVLGRLEGLLVLGLNGVFGCCGSHYFSTHGCMRLDSCFVVGAFEELALAALACRAFMLKKSAIVAVVLGLRLCCRDVGQLLKCDASTRDHELTFSHRPC